MIGGDVVADHMAQRPPDQLHLLLGKIIAGLMDVAPIAQLEGDVMQALGLVAGEVDGVVIDAAAQEGEVIAHPVGHAEAQDVAIEGGDLLHVMDAIGHMAEFQGVDALFGAVIGREVIFGEDLDQRALGVAEGDGVLDARRDPRAALALDADRLQLGRQFAQIRARRHLKGDGLEGAGLRAALQHHAFLAELGGEHHPVLVARDHAQADDLCPVVQLLFHVGGREGGVAQPFHLNHLFLRGGEAPWRACGLLCHAPRALHNPNRELDLGRRMRECLATRFKSERNPQGGPHVSFLRQRRP